jgi:hypothetical protein
VHHCPPGHRAPDNLLGRVLDIGGLIDQCGILAAEFQKDRRQVFGGCPRHNLSGAGAAGEENEVEGKLEKLRRFFAMARCRLYGFGFEEFRNEVHQQ